MSALFSGKNIFKISTAQAKVTVDLPIGFINTQNAGYKFQQTTFGNIFSYFSQKTDPEICKKCQSIFWGK